MFLRFYVIKEPHNALQTVIGTVRGKDKKGARNAIQGKFPRGKGHAVVMQKEEIGLNDVYMIRKRLDASLPLDRIEGRIKMTSRDVIVILTEEQARLAGLFLDRKTVTVTGKPGFLNRHVRKHVICERDDETGEIWSAQIFREIDEAAVLEEWAAMDYPLEWPDLEEDAQAD